MNQALFLSELRKVCLVVIAYCAGKGWLSAADSSLLGGVLPAVGLLAGPWLWGLYTMINTKLVPKDSVAVESTNVVGAAVKGASVSVQGVAKVVGCLLFAMTLFTLGNGEANAAPFCVDALNRIPIGCVPPKAESRSAGTTAVPTDATFANFAAEIQKLEKKVVDAAVLDVQSAIDDATSHNDAISLPCWQSTLSFLNGLPTQWQTPPTSIGLALGIQIQRDLINQITGNDAKSLKVACAALLGDQLKIITNIAGMIGIRIATGGFAG